MLDDIRERKGLYAECRNDLLKRQLSNAENFDKSIMSLSTAGLGFSLAFIKDVVPLSQAKHLFFLYGSWYLFAAAIVSTLISFLTSQHGINRQLIYAEEYYLNEREEFLKSPNWPAKITVWLNHISGLVFISAIILTILFVSLNTTGE